MKRTFVYIGILLCLSACAEFIEYPLEQESVALRAPVDGLATRDSIITFWWDTHEDAKYYRLQIVQHSFGQSEALIADSVVVKNQLTLTLDTGAYAWRVRPENNGSAGLFKEERVLTVHE